MRMEIIFTGLGLVGLALLITMIDAKNLWEYRHKNTGLITIIMGIVGFVIVLVAILAGKNW